MTHRQKKPMRRTREMDYRFKEKPSTRVIKQDAILWMTFDDSDQSNGALVSDHSDFGNHGTITGATNGVGKNTKALYFDGINDKVEIPDSASLDATGGLSFCYWIQYGQPGVTQMIINKFDGATGYYSQIDGNNQVTFFIFGGSESKGTSTSVFNPSIGRWYHVCCVFRVADTLKIYINGEEHISINTTADGIGTNNNAVQLGIFGSTQDFKGILGGLQLWKRSLSSSEISDLYEGDL